MAETHVTLRVMEDEIVNNGFCGEEINSLTLDGQG